jgi:hypothetical protein
MWRIFRHRKSAIEAKKQTEQLTKEMRPLNEELRKVQKNNHVYLLIRETLQ